MKRVSGILGWFSKTEKLPFQPVFAFLSEAGGRKVNQDAVSYQEAGGRHCWLVADGLGGHGGGEIASRLVCETIAAEFSINPSLDRIEEYFRLANDAVLEAQQHGRYSAMQSTVVELVLDDTKACWGHIGDSRLYLFRQGQLVHQTKDHSVPQTLADIGEIRPEEIRRHEDRNRLLRAVGSPKAFRAAIAAPAELAKGDAFLLCTDGFWDYVLEEEMAADLHSSATPAEWLQRMQQRLLARASGEFDNYSAAAVWLTGKN